jgi:hypothetical protein
MDTRDRAEAAKTSRPDVDPPAQAPADHGAPGREYDDIDEAVEETMIASDPPAFSPQTSIGPPGRAGVDADKGHRD